MRRNDRPSLRAGTKPLNRGVLMKASLLLMAYSGAFAARPWQGSEAAVHGDSSLFTRSSQNNPVTPESTVTTHRHRAILLSSHAAPKTADSSLCSLCLHPSLCSEHLIWIPEHLLQALSPNIHFSLLPVHCGFRSTSRIVLCVEAKLPTTQTSPLPNPIYSSMLTPDIPIYTLCR